MSSTIRPVSDEPNFHCFTTALGGGASDAPARMAFAPLSLGQPLVPSRTIVTNSSASSSGKQLPMFIPVVSTDYNTFPNPGLGRARPLAARPAAMTSHSLPSNKNIAAPPVTPVTLSSPSSSAADISLGSSPGGPMPTLAGGKRRLGMGRSGTGYSNKKFKTPGL